MTRVYIEFDALEPVVLEAHGTTGPVTVETTGDWNEFIALTMNKDTGDDDEAFIALSPVEARDLRDRITAWLATEHETES